MLGETLGNYRIDSQIGSGGMGIVYSAEHVLLGKRAAIKVLKPERCESQEIVSRFFNEARAASMIKHPGIPEIFDYGHLPDGNAYIIMEMLEGVTLGEILDNRTRLTPGRTLALTRLMAGTLMATHEAGIIHRDLKPDNVFVVPDAAMPRGERIQILDFGIAKLQNNTSDSSVQTETGRLMGTPYYMSPEQCRGAGNIDHRTDIYSLGCVLYQMLCGRPPFAMKGSGEILAAHIHLIPQAPREIEKSVPVRLEELILRLLAKDPGDRPQTMQEVISELNQIAAMAKMDTPEPSLAASMEIPVGAVAAMSNQGDSLADTIDDAASEYFNTAMSGADMSTLGIKVDVEGNYERIHTGTAAVRRKSAGTRAIVIPIAVVLGLGLGGWGTYQLLDKGTTTSSESEDTPNSLANAQPSEKSADRIIVRELVEVPVETKYISLALDSQPRGARVYRLADGVEVGRTPLTVQVLQGQGVMSFLLRKTGYGNTRIDLPVVADRKEMVTLNSRNKRRDNKNRSGNDGEKTEESTDAVVTNPVAKPVDSPNEKPQRGQILNPDKTGRLGTWTE